MYNNINMWLVFMVVVFHLPKKKIIEPCYVVLGFQENNEAVCFKEKYDIVCNNSKLIQIRKVHFGRFFSTICLAFNNPEICNASIWGQQFVEEKCQNHSSCLISFDESHLPQGNCQVGQEPYAQIVYYCKDNTSLSDIWMDTISGDDRTPQVVLYSVLGSVLFIITILTTVAIIRIRVNYGRSKSKLQDHKQLRINNVLDNNVESQYDEISIAETLPQTDQYHHIKFKRSIKTNDTSYSSAYNHTTINKSTNHIAYDVSPAFGENHYQNNEVNTL